MNANKRNRLSKKFRRMKLMAGAAIVFMVGAFIPIATVSAVCVMFSALLFFATLMYFLGVAMWEGRISQTSEAIRDAKDE